MKTKDHVFESPDGYYCLVDGRTFGPWAYREYARAGMKTERMRVALRAIQARNNQSNETGEQT